MNGYRTMKQTLQMEHVEVYCLKAQHLDLTTNMPESISLHSFPV